MYNEQREKQINYYLKLSGAILILLTAVFLVVVSGSLAHYLDSSAYKKTITVSGFAEMNIAPDMRLVYISIVGKGKTEKEAQSDASKKSQKVSDALKAQKTAEADIKNQDLSTYPEYQTKTDCPNVEASPKAVYNTMQPYYPCNQNSVITGYKTTQSIEVTLRGEAMKQAGDMVANLTSDGVTVQTSEAKLENPETSKTEVRSKAIVDARKNAEKTAESLGVTLGKVESFSEDNSGYAPGMYNMQTKSMSASDESAPAPVISNGSQQITSTVSVSFEIR
ncbi:MAG: SIMPL domain-containing protein [bacterium]